MSALHLLRSRETPVGLMPELVNATIGHKLPSARELTMLLASFARRALWRSAVVLLSQARDVVDMPALGAALAACERGSQWHIAAALLEDFHLQLLSPDDGAAASVLSACGKAGRWPAACQLFEALIRTKDRGHREEACWCPEWSRTGTSAVTAYGCNHEWRKAIHVLEDLHSNALQVNAAPFNAAIRALSAESGARSQTRERRWQMALITAEELMLFGPEPDSITLNTAVSTCASARAWRAAVSTINVAQRWLDVIPDSISLNTAMSACERAQEWEYSLALFYCEMPRLRIEPTLVSFNAAISTCAAAGLWQAALHLLESMSGCRLRPDVVSCNSVLTSCGRGFEWRRAVQLLRTMQTLEEPRPDLVSFNTALAAVANSRERGDWERALALLEAMQKERLLPDLISFNTAMDTCTGSQRWEVVLQLLEDLRQHGLRADLHTATAAASACAHGEQWQLGLFLADICAQRHRPDVQLYSTKLFVCEKGLQWELAIHLLSKMFADGIALDSISSSIAIRACATRRSWDLALWVLNELCGRDRDPGAKAYLAAVDALEASNGPPASPELFEELCRKAALSSVFAA